MMDESLTYAEISPGMDRKSKSNENLHGKATKRLITCEELEEVFSDSVQRLSNHSVYPSPFAEAGVCSSICSCTTWSSLLHPLSES